jgi:hypothetical protein
MKSLTEHLTFNIPARVGFVNITREVEDLVRRSGVQEGLVGSRHWPRSTPRPPATATTGPARITPTPT